MSAVLDGILVVDKPEGMTSHDVVATVRRRLPRKTKVGHTGTLDPFATGVLPIVIGKATRLSQFLTAGHKRYLATVTFGIGTDSGDRMGRVVETALPDALASLDAATVSEALTHFVGTLPQVPPLHSAKMVGGERAYVLARRGELVALPPVEVTAHALVLTGWDAATRTATVDLEVAAGYYVRSLARDLGARLGVPAHLTALRRTGSGAWTLHDAHTLGDVVEAATGAFAAMCQPMASVLQDWPVLTLNDDQLQAVLAGRRLDLEARQIDALGQSPAERVRLLDAAGALVGVAQPSAIGSLHADIVLR